MPYIAVAHQIYTIYYIPPSRSLSNLLDYAVSLSVSCLPPSLCRSPHAHSHTRKPAGRQTASMQALRATLAAASSLVCLPSFPAGIRVWPSPSLAPSMYPRAGGRRRVISNFDLCCLAVFYFVCFTAGTAGHAVSVYNVHQQKAATYTRKRPQYNMNTKNYCGVYVASSYPFSVVYHFSP